MHPEHIRLIFPNWVPKRRANHTPANCSQRCWTAFRGLVYRRRWCGVVEYRDRARNMTIPARDSLLLQRRMAGKRATQHSDERKGRRFGVQTQALSADCQHLVEFGQRFARATTSEAANGKTRSNARRRKQMRLERSVTAPQTNPAANRPQAFAGSYRQSLLALTCAVAISTTAFRAAGAERKKVSPIRHRSGKG